MGHKWFYLSLKDIKTDKERRKINVFDKGKKYVGKKFLPKKSR